MASLIDNIRNMTGKFLLCLSNLGNYIREHRSDILDTLYRKQPFTIPNVFLDASFYPHLTDITILYERTHYTLALDCYISYTGNNKYIRKLIDAGERQFMTFQALNDYLDVISDEEKHLNNTVEVFYRVIYKNRPFSFRFFIKNLGTEQIPDYRAYIQAKFINYRGRKTMLDIVHLLYDEIGHRICWSTPLALDDLMTVIQLWSKATAIYIQDGVTIDATFPLIVENS